jgi:hypothetical protein
MWALIAANLTQGIASVAASLQPHPVAATHQHDPATMYDTGGREYDEFQLATLKGFTHSHNISDIPQIWPLFQYTKHMDAHRENIKRRMTTWARNAKPDQVNIDRGLYFPNTVMKDILALRFNPGGPTAEAATAHHGLSILICRPLTAEGKAVLRRKEQLEATSKRKTFAEAALDEVAPEPTIYPDDFNELHLCIGTYCALLHTLFGERCVFYKHCYKLWMTMQSEIVYDHRYLFTATFCRQILWAIIEYGRAYFSQRLSLDDFIGVHPDDISYPRSNLIELEPFIRTQTQLVRASFPANWNIIKGPAATGTTGSGLPSVIGGQQGSASVVSGVSAGSSATQRTNTTATQRATLVLRQNNIHPTIKTAVDPYFKKVQALKLTQLLNHANITIDDLPSLPGHEQSQLCYNFILGHCTMRNCPRADAHVNATEVTDEFATELIQKLRPGMTEFMTNGAPRKAKRRRRT